MTIWPVAAASSDARWAWPEAVTASTVRATPRNRIPTAATTIGSIIRSRIECQVLVREWTGTE